MRHNTFIEFNQPIELNVPGELVMEIGDTLTVKCETHRGGQLDWKFPSNSKKVSTIRMCTYTTYRAYVFVYKLYFMVEKTWSENNLPLSLPYIFIIKCTFASQT